MKPRDIALKSHDKHLDKFNEHTLKFRDSCLLSAEDCDDIIRLMDSHEDRLAGNRASLHLRRLLFEAIDVIRCEDAIAVLDKFPNEQEQQPDPPRFPKPEISGNDIADEIELCAEELKKGKQSGLVNPPQRQA